MPVAGLTGRVRALREAKLKLGYLKRGDRFPSDSDQFIAKTADGVSPEVLAAYDAQPIEAQESGVYGLGRAIRCLIPSEFDMVGRDGREVWLELLNRMWGKSRIRCSGTGGGAGFDEAGQPLTGEAWLRDPVLRGRFQHAGLELGERPGGGWVERCQGPDCPLWHAKRTDQDKTPACHREMRLRFILLHPASYDRTRSLDEQNDDYLRQLAWVEVATGSWNGAIDVQSGLTVIRAIAGKTAMVPFTLRRVRRSVSAPEGRVFKDTLMVTSDADEVLIMAASGRALLRPALRRQLAEIEQAESVAGLPEARYDDVADIQPQPDRRVLPAPPVVHPGRPSDRDEALADTTTTSSASAATSPAPPAPGEQVRLLGVKELNKLKELCGGKPGDPASQGRYRELMEQSYQALGVPMDERGDVDRKCEQWRPYPGRPDGKPAHSQWFTTRHRAWVEERIAQDGQQTELLDEDDV